MHRRQFIIRLASAACVLLLLRLLIGSFSSQSTGNPSISLSTSRNHHQPEPRKALIVASLKNDNVSWFEDHLSDWERFIYVVDDPSAKLTVATNKGRESNVYLSFIIDNYNNLPDNMVFLHALRYQWHNEDPMYDGLPMIKNLRLQHVQRQGFANLRCTWSLGCPHEIVPNPGASASTEDYSVKQVEAAYAEAFSLFFPGEPVPKEVGATCCAQFAMSKEQVLRRPKADYELYRSWLHTTKLDDSISGRIIEYLWHLLMGKSAVHCPNVAQCFCDMYGLCSLDCEEGSCQNRYILAPYATIPQNWPEEGPGRDGWPERDWYV